MTSKLLLLSVFIGLLGCQSNAQNQGNQVDKGEIYLDSMMQKVASIYSEQGQLYADTASMINPKSAVVYQNRAVPFLKNGDFEKWIFYIDKAVALDAKKYMDYRAFCKAIFIKDYDGAIKDFDVAQKIKGNEINFVMDHTYEFFKSLCYLEMGQLDSAKVLMQKSVDWQLKNKTLEWTHYVDLFYLGVIYWELKDVQKAQYYIDLSLKKYAQFPDANYYKALILNHLGRKGEAMEYVLTIEPNWKKGYRMNEDNEIYCNYPHQIGVGELADLKAILMK
jgi:tetratricopeptide (TPR) repeat protein